MTDLEKLKPCPFCGSEARLLGGAIAQESYSVWCNSKEGRQHHLSGSMDRDATIAAWNTRASDAALLVAERALRPFSEMAGEMFAANWNDDGVAISFVTKDGPMRITFKEFREARAALSEIAKLMGGSDDRA